MGKIKNNSLKVAREMLKPYGTVFGRNKTSLKAKIINTPIGSLMVVSDENHLLMLKSIDSPTLSRELKHLTELYSKPIIEDDNAKPLTLIESELEAYFRGDLIEFKTPFKFESFGTEFQRAVWMEINKIKHGETSTYSELAQRIEKPNSYRAVANACGRNPIAIIVPCHRILASGGKLGGYTGGVEKKEWLLEHEKKIH